MYSLRTILLYSILKRNVQIKTPKDRLQSVFFSSTQPTTTCIIEKIAYLIRVKGLMDAAQETS